ncbi:MAG: SdrD B-like domain-containing protein [Anaerolineales bacterium]
MQRRPLRKPILSFLILMLLVLGCNLTGGGPANLPATQTALAYAVIQYSTSAGGSPTPTPIPPPGSRIAPSPTRTQTPAFTPTASSTVTQTATLSVVHIATPPGTSGTSRYITDPVSKDYAAQKRVPGGSDVYAGNRYERPFTAETMDYLSDVDLSRVELKLNPPWVYVTFQFAAARADGIGKTMYGAEFDTNRDGRGEYLVWGLSPAGAEWTTDGVEVWKDSDSDVGGPHPQLSDAPWAGGNGYDQRIFSGGQGADPDLAWIRQIEGGTKVQLAFKYSAIGNAPQFLWNGLADLGVRNPAWFDYNDHFTQAEAGSPLPIQSDFYPLKALWGIDNTCHDAYGFTPTGMEPGLCQYYGTISGQLCWDINHDGTCDATELTTAPIAGDVISLGQGACPASGFKSTVTDSQGRYSFTDLTAGTYCLGFTHIPAPGFLINSNPMTVTLSPEETKVVNLSIPW